MVAWTLTQQFACSCNLGRQSSDFPFGLCRLNDDNEAKYHILFTPNFTNAGRHVWTKYADLAMIYRFRLSIRGLGFARVVHEHGMEEEQRR